MFLSSIIPYFLAAHINSTAWEFGPEYVFRTGISGEYNFTDGEFTTLTIDVKTDAFCRPNGENILSCQFRTSTIHRKRNNITTAFITVPLTDDTKEFNFNIEFDKQGVKSYYVKKENEGELIDLKLSIGNLNMGIDFTNRMEGKFKDFEKSIAGECMADFMITKTPRDEMSDEMKYELRSTVNKNLPENIHVKKCRDVKNCNYFKYFLSVTLVLPEVNLDSPVNVKNYCGEMNISDKSFSTINYMEGTINHDKYVIDFFDKYLLELVDIRPATQKLEGFDEFDIVSSAYVIPKKE